MKNDMRLRSIKLGKKMEMDDGMMHFEKLRRIAQLLIGIRLENYDKDAPFGAGKKHFQGAKREQQTV